MAKENTNSIPADDLPGVAIDIADNETASVKEESQRTAVLNNNPRNNGDII